MENEKNLDPRPVLGEAITELGRRELCELVSAICGRVLEEVGSAGYRGGLFPENIRAGEDGTVELGAAAKENWQGQELSFLAPEVFWNGEGSPASDVYSLGLLLYYAMDSGRLPFAKDGEELAHKRRMNGESFDPPKAAGRRLGEIVAKATRFQASERYRSVAELKAVLDSCAANPYLAFTLLIYAGLEGMGQNMTPPQSIEANLYKEDPALMRGLEQLPASRQEAMQCAMESELVRRHVPKSCLEAYVYEGKK